MTSPYGEGLLAEQIYARELIASQLRQSALRGSVTPARANAAIGFALTYPGMSNELMSGAILADVAPDDPGMVKLVLEEEEDHQRSVWGRLRSAIGDVQGGINNLFNPVREVVKVTDAAFHYKAPAVADFAEQQVDTAMSVAQAGARGAFLGMNSAYQFGTGLGRAGVAVYDNMEQLRSDGTVSNTPMDIIGAPFEGNDLGTVIGSGFGLIKPVNIGSGIIPQATLPEDRESFGPDVDRLVAQGMSTQEAEQRVRADYDQRFGRPEVGFAGPEWAGGDSPYLNQQRRRTGVTYRGESASLGRLVAHQATSVPGLTPVLDTYATHIPFVSDMVDPSRPGFSLLSGVADAAIAIAADPAHGAGKAARIRRVQGSTFSNIPVMTGKYRQAAGTLQVDDALRGTYAPLVHHLDVADDGAEKFLDLFDMFESSQRMPVDARLLVEMAQSQGMGEDAIRELLKARMVTGGITTAPNPVTGRAAQAALRGTDESTQALGALGGARFAGRVVGNDRHPLLFRYMAHMPGETLTGWDQGITNSLRDFDRVIRQTGLTRSERAKHLYEFAQLDDFDRVGARTILKNVFGDHRSAEFARLSRRYDGDIPRNAKLRFDAIHDSFGRAMDEVDDLDELTRADIAENFAPGRRFEATGIGDEVQMIPSAQEIQDYLGRRIALPDPRHVRIAQSRFAYLTRHTDPIFGEALENVLEPRVYAALTTGAMEKFWKPVTLLRGAWTVRIIGEEMARNAAAGLTTYVNHPITALRISLGAVGDESRLGALVSRLDELTGAQTGMITHSPAGVRYALEDAVRQTLHQKALSRGTMNIAEVGSQQAVAAKLVPLRPGEASYNTAWNARLRTAHNDPIQRRVAESILSGEGETQLIHWLLDEGKDALDQWAGIDDARRALVTKIRTGANTGVANWDEARRFIRYQTAEVHRLAGGRARIVNGIMVGTDPAAQYPPLTSGRVFFDDTGRKVAPITAGDVDDFWHQTTTAGNEDLLRAIYSGELDGNNLTFAHRGAIASLDDYLENAPERIMGLDYAAVEAARGRADKLVEKMFSFFMSGPTNFMNRSPAFRQFQWKAVRDLLPYTDDSTIDTMLARAKLSNLPKDMMDELTEVANVTKTNRIDGPSIMFRDYNASDVTAAIQRSIDDIPPTASNLPPLYTGTKSQIPRQLDTAGTIEKTADMNLFGPALYMSDELELAATYYERIGQLRAMLPDMDETRVIEELVKARAAAMELGEGSIEHIRFIPDRAPNVLNFDTAGGFAKFDDAVTELFDEVLPILEQRYRDIVFPKIRSAGGFVDDADPLGVHRTLDSLSEGDAHISSYNSWATNLHELRVMWTDVDDGWTRAFDDWMRGALGDDIADSIAALPDGTGVKKVSVVINQWLHQKHNIDAIEYLGGVRTGSSTRHRAFAWLNTSDLEVEDALDMFANSWVAEQGGLVRNAADFLEQVTGTKALIQVQDLLYDLSNRHAYMDAARLLFPFGEAWVEILSAWSKLLAARPVEIPRRAQQAFQAARMNGFFHEGPNGEETLTMPGGGIMADALGAFGLFGDQDASISLESPITGFNLFTQSMLPGFGPVVQIPARFLPESNTAFDGIKDFITPYDQSPISGAGDALEALLPAWLDKAQRAALAALGGGQEDPETRESLYGTTIDIARGMLTSGAYPDTPEGRQAAIEAAGTGAKFITFARALIQFTAPASPILEYEARTTNPPSSIIPQGEDTEGKLWAVNLLVSDYQAKLRENNFEDAPTILWFIGAYGFDPTSLITAKSREILPRTETTEGFKFQRNNEDLFDEYGYTAYYAWPDDPDDDFDFTAYFSQINEGTRERLSGDEWLEAGNHARASLIYRAVSGELEDTEANRTYLRALRETLAYEYPGYRTYDIGLGRRPSTDEMIFQLKQWPVDNPTVQTPEGEMAVMDTPAGKGLAQYLAVRSWALAEAESRYDVISLRAQAAEPLREELRHTAQAIINDPATAAFADMWLGVFKRELDQANDEAPTLVEVNR